MGAFSSPIRLTSMDGGQSVDLEATVDTEAAYTTVPTGVLRQLGVEPTGRGRFFVADGRRVEMDVGRAWVTIDGESEITLVAFGEEDGPAILGAYALEGLRLAPDLVEQRLVPTDLIMY